jgi:hypothetical protein
VALVNRPKAAPPYFAALFKAPAPQIIIRRVATYERIVTPGPGIQARSVARTAQYGDRRSARQAAQPRRLRRRAFPFGASTPSS